jgi:protein O-mannosyl-transferase
MVADAALHTISLAVLLVPMAVGAWYVRVIGAAFAAVIVYSWMTGGAHPARGEAPPGSLRRRAPLLTGTLFAAFLFFQCVQAYRHTMDYRDDVTFWGATKDAVPYSAKAHLNYSVMKGARGDLDIRLAESKLALALAPKWPMAHIYTGDTLCRQDKAEEAWPYYKEGFDLGPNELSLIALALQCMYDKGVLTAHDKELRALADEHEGSWIAYLAIDTLTNADKNKGVDPKYRPRGYNEGPKE